jgi:D-3-phosphoglycerate dehydrogenase
MVANRLLKMAILDDYQDVARSLDCFSRVADRDVLVLHDHVGDVEALAERLGGVEALLLIRERTPVTRELLARLPALRLISQSGPVPHIDLQACAERGVTVCSITVPSRPSVATAELTWGLVLAAWRRIPQEAAHLRAGAWQSREAVGRTLRGRTLGIHGYGGIGALVAGYGRAFGMQVLAFGREGSLRRAREDGVEVAADDRELFARSDVLSLHLALTPQTRGIVRREHLALMKPDALIVNTSRAGLIEPGALADALRAGRPGLAALDVFDVEPAPIDDPLPRMPNVVATPHLGYVERENLENMFARMVEQVLAFEAGRPVNVVTAPA